MKVVSIESHRRRAYWQLDSREKAFSGTEKEKAGTRRTTKIRRRESEKEGQRERERKRERAKNRGRGRLTLRLEIALNHHKSKIYRAPFSLTLDGTDRRRDGTEPRKSATTSVNNARSALRTSFMDDYKEIARRALDGTRSYFTSGDSERPLFHVTMFFHVFAHGVQYPGGFEYYRPSMLLTKSAV